MQVVCEATQYSATEVQVASFECLVRIMGLYYDKMGFYMERALFGVSCLSQIPERVRCIDFIILAYLSGHETCGRGRCTSSHRILVDCLRRGDRYRSRTGRGRFLTIVFRIAETQQVYS